MPESRKGTVRGVEEIHKKLWSELYPLFCVREVELRYESLPISKSPTKANSL